MGLKNVLILGATGAVGREFLDVLEERGFPVGNLILCSSPRSAGARMTFRGGDVVVSAVDESQFEGVDIALFSAGSEPSKVWGPIAVSAGAVVVDNSSAFRMDPEVPLVVPEINFDSVRPQDKLIANPNCTAIILMMAVFPLTRLGKVRRLVVSTYQSASGAGIAAVRELENQTRALLEGRPPAPEVFPHPIAFNVFSHNSAVDVDGWNGEERKVVQECRKILGNPDLAINVTCVRVPVRRAHTESITVEFEDRAPSEDQVRSALSEFPGVRVVDDRANNRFPMPSEAEGGDDVLVGRIRTDVSHPSAISLLACGDQLRKGAALNAVQIAERVMTREG
ncbi:MAG: aspartate-semialdehyde dehydrogenase [Fimbriimonadaceae bacterium]|nr:Aspartate-semialdehyde dehydrogenase [Fimbriimonadaceae bacterium]MCL4284891.1 aspartate-semialdehyde dehydrogenase [Fimbriimonadaceae bacterium]QOJ12389.1 MAG: aspartate-semialdehyde dehydrogenase [Chthonomonadaceae bacterium]